MIKNKVLIIIALIIFSLLLISSDFISSNSVSSAEVQAAIDSSNSGDIVIIPKGYSEWTSSVSIPSNKKIILAGASSRKTIIKSNMSNPVIYMNRSGSRITNIGFELQNNTGSCITARGTDWRVDHCRFINIRSDRGTIPGVYAYGLNESDGHPIGVVDHNEFYDTRVLVLGSLALMANTIWHESLGLGTNNAVFVEDNVFTRTHGNAIDANYGGRYVFRYNTVNDAYIEAHAVQGYNRAARSWEIYNNTINQVNIPMWVPMFLRGGTGVVFNNTITGNWSGGGFALDYRRCCENLGPGFCREGVDSGGWDDPAGNDQGYPCRDQIGRSTDQWYWDWNNDPTNVPSQALDPAYCWNNKHSDGSNIDFYIFDNCPPYVDNVLDQGTDFYNNQAKPGYTSYAYPHPLVQEDKYKAINIRIK